MFEANFSSRYGLAAPLTEKIHDEEGRSPSKTHVKKKQTKNKTYYKDEILSTQLLLLALPSAWPFLGDLSRTSSHPFMTKFYGHKQISERLQS